MLNIYRASAGSGKTYRLTQDYIYLLLDPKRERTHRHILAVTFTNKATDEMKSRILHELHALAQGQRSDYRDGLMKRYRMQEEEVNLRARKVLVDILHDYSSFSISTIDSFFQQVIRAFARDIGVNGTYNLELDSNRTLEQAVDNLFLDLSKSENRQLLQWLTQLAEERVEQSENWNMRGSIVDLGKEIFKENFQYRAEEINRKLHDRHFLDDYRKELRAIKNAFEQRVKTTASEALHVIALYGLHVTDFKGGTRSPMKKLELLRSGHFDKPDTLIALAEGVETCYAAKSTKPDVVEAIRAAYENGLGQCLHVLADCFTKDIIMYNSAEIALKHLNTLGVLADLAVQIKTLTEEQNTMLISDTNMLLNRIIDNSETPFVYERTGIRVDHYMIDEFQDTSVLQWKNFRPLLGDSLAAGLFNLVVGDVKQSIYRWRNSDWKLLDEQVLHDFRPEQLREENLDTNWRSDRHIVDFNNAFFRKAAQVLQGKLDENMAGAFPQGKTPRHLRQRIIHAYDHLYQKTSPRAGEGHVQFCFIDKKENDEGWQQESLNRLPALLEDLQDRGYAPGDIAILVRWNAEERMVTNHLLNYKTTSSARSGYCYDVMGNEGLRVDSAVSVRFLIGVLHLLMFPDDKIQRFVVRYEYFRGRRELAEQDALNACFSASGLEDAVSPFDFMSDKEQQVLSQVRHRTLYELVEVLIELFALDRWGDEAVFIQAFQDIVLKFISGRATDLNSFLTWWGKNGADQCVPSPDNGQAVRIMTIHKSKGLDFPVVIMPFCDWTLESRKRDILWCEPQKPPFNRFPLLPVEYVSKLGKSVFAPEYFDEQMHQYIDSLNIAYVAFTRAKHELLCMAPAQDKETAGQSKVSSLAALLQHCFLASGTMDDGKHKYVALADSYDVEGWQFELGKPTVRQSAEKQAFHSDTALLHYPVTDPAGRLQVRHLGLDFWLEGQQLADSAVNYGTVMHHILQKMFHRADEERALNECRLNGLITESDMPMVRQVLERFWQLPHVEEWFAADVEVLNEAAILTPDGHQYRPDRVVLKGDVVQVIDYKFGSGEQPGYHAQVRQYMQLLAQMGYRPQGFLCYVTLGKVVPVTA